MKTIVLTVLLLCFANPFINAQEVISGKSQPQKFNFEPTYERGLPPNLYVDLNFQDDNQNGIIESKESAKLELSITNKGKGKAQGLVVEVKDNVNDKNFHIGDNQKIYFIEPDETKQVTIPLNAGFDVKSAEHKLQINVKEHFGYDMDPAFLLLNTLAYQKPELVFSGMEIVDQGEGTGAITPDGLLQAGELVKAKIVVQNVGQNIAKNVTYKVETRDQNIYLDQNTGKLGDMAIGEVKEFWVSISPNKRVATQKKLPVYLKLNEEFGKGNLDYFQLPVTINQKPPEKNIQQIEADIDALKKQVARFEYTSNKFKANVGNVIAIDQVVPSKTKRKNAVAVVIGVENYEDLPPAPYAERDAEIMKKYFKTRLGIDQVVTLTGKEVSGFAFDDMFNPDYGELQKAIVKDQTDVFVFYSGHGVPNKKGDQIYLFPQDGKVERLETQGYNINKLYTSLENLEAKSVTLFLDACFSGSSKSSENIEAHNLVAMKGVQIKPKMQKPWQKSDSFSVFTSSSADETSLGFDPSKTGLFTYFLTAGLQGKADANSDRKITMGELKNYVIENVINTSKKITGLQTPEFNGNEEQILLEY
jgi:hypothetical protein